MNLKQTLDKLAKRLVDETDKKDTSLADLLDTFKELRAYHAMNLKHAPPEEPDGADGFTFDGGLDNGLGERNGAAGIHRRRSS